MKPISGELLFDFFERLLAKVTDFHHLILALLSEFHDGADARTLKAVVASDTEVEFFDHHALIFVFLRLDLFFDEAVILNRVIKMGELVEVGRKKLGGHRNGLVRFDGAVGGDLKGQFVELGVVLNTGWLDVEGDFDDRRVVAVGWDDADGVDLALDLVAFASDIATALTDEDGHLEVSFAVEMGDFKILVDDAHHAWELKVAGFKGAWAFEINGKGLDVVGGAVDLENEVFEVEDDGGHIFFNAWDGGEFMTDAFDLNREDAGSWKGAKQDAAKGVANGEAESSFERFDHETGVVLVLIIDIDL